MNGCPVEHSKSKNQARGKDDIASGFSTGVVVVVVVVVVAYIVILCWGRLLELSSSIDLLIVIFTTALLGTIVWDNKLNVFNIKSTKLVINPTTKKVSRPV
jgi:Ca2+/Na+ antiporter